MLPSIRDRVERLTEEETLALEHMRCNHGRQRMEVRQRGIECLLRSSRMATLLGSAIGEQLRAEGLRLPEEEEERRRMVRIIGFTMWNVFFRLFIERNLMTSDTCDRIDRIAKHCARLVIAELTPKQCVTADARVLPGHAA